MIRVGEHLLIPYGRAMGTFETIARTVEQLAAARQRVDLARAAKTAGLSPAHLQRSFTKMVGISPMRFQQALSVERARSALAQSQTVLDATWESGLSSPGRLHDALVRLEAMTPGELKAGPALRWTEVATALGPLTLAATRRGLSGATFDGLAGLTARWPRATLVRDDEALAGPAEALRRCLDGSQPLAPLTILVPGTALQLAVWRALLEIPEGAVVTYGHLAQRVGQPGAARAVANAVGANPVACLIPCHRVIRATGALGGYRWGLARKAALLARELEAGRREGATS
jgi:AraC family transcriptional regulator of adaptative response/methylated-DNA-[protein]-cysteine methyltransferase